MHTNNRTYYFSVSIYEVGFLEMPVLTAVPLKLSLDLAHEVRAAREGVLKKREHFGIKPLSKDDFGGGPFGINFLSEPFLRFGPIDRVALTVTGMHFSILAQTSDLYCRLACSWVPIDVLGEAALLPHQDERNLRAVSPQVEATSPCPPLGDVRPDFPH